MGMLQVGTKRLGTATLIFNSITPAATSMFQVETLAGAMVVGRKTANTTALSYTIQGSVDNVLWQDTAAAITTAVGTSITQPWPYLRVNVGTITNTAKTITLAQTAGVATATCTSHGFLAGEYVTVAGANQSGYNGSVLILTRPDANTFTYAVDAATVSPGTGTITANGNFMVYVVE